jgi:hypothetical protein
MSIRFKAFHLNFWKTYNATVSSNRQPSFKMNLPSSLERIDQLLIQNAPLNITCKINLYCDLRNTKSFLLIHNAQHRAANPISTRFLCFFEKLLSQGPKRCLTSIGLVIPSVEQIIPHISLAMGQSKNKCWIVSCSVQKQYKVHPFQRLFTKLSLVKTTPFLRYQRKILIFRGILAFVGGIRNLAFRMRSHEIISVSQAWFKRPSYETPGAIKSALIFQNPPFG